MRFTASILQKPHQHVAFVFYSVVMISVRKYFCILLVCFVCTTTLQAQSIRKTYQQSNAWLMYFGSFQLQKHFGLHAEAQLRQSDVFTNQQQLLLRGGLNYYWTKQLSLTAGYCYVETYPYGALPAKLMFPEHRIWQQLQLKSGLGRMEFINRFRLEQRFVSSINLGSNQMYELGDAIYTNRIRLLQRVSIPVKGTEIKDKSIYLTAYNEVFVNFGENVRYNLLDQNRAYLALGYKLPKLGRLELGYLNQLIFKGDGINVENNHTLQLGLNVQLNLMKQAQ